MQPAHQSDPHHPNPTEDQKKHAPKSAALNGLAVVGFIALLLIGITLAIFSARYVPAAVTKLSNASAGLVGNASSSESKPASLTVVSSTTTTVPFPGDMQGIPQNPGAGAVDPSTIPPQPTQPTKPVVTPAPVVTKPQHVAPYGLSDLKTSVVETGFLANGTNESFVPARVIPAGARAAVRFTVTNVGTNVTGSWGFIAQLPTSNGYVFTSPVEQNLNPGDHILFTLGFDQVQITPGPQVVTVVADPNNQLPESNEGNNSDSAAFSIAGY